MGPRRFKPLLIHDLGIVNKASSKQLTSSKVECRSNYKAKLLRWLKIAAFKAIFGLLWTRIRLGSEAETLVTILSIYVRLISRKKMGALWNELLP